MAAQGLQDRVQQELRELDMGEWENVSLQELREKRGKQLNSEPEHGESRQEGLKRFGQAIEKVLSCSNGDIVCVAHAGVNCCYLSRYLGEPLEISRSLPQPYGCLSVIEAEENGRKRVVRCGIMPEKAPDIKACERMWEHYHTPAQVRAHCQAVCEQALKIGNMLNQNGCDLNLDVIQSAALLHDIARLQKHHTKTGGELFLQLGYPEISQIISQHHGLLEATLDEAAIVFLADKLIQETQRVTIEKRFADSMSKCKSPEARKAHEQQLEQARKLQDMIQSLCHITL